MNKFNPKQGRMVRYYTNQYEEYEKYLKETEEIDKRYSEYQDTQLKMGHSVYYDSQFNEDWDAKKQLEREFLRQQYVAIQRMKLPNVNYDDVIEKVESMAHLIMTRDENRFDKARLKLIEETMQTILEGLEETKKWTDKSVDRWSKLYED